MKRHTFLSIISCILFPVVLSANGLEINNVTPSEDNTSITFDISWENSWRQTERFHDAVWIFIKYKPDNSSNWVHAYVTSGTAGGNMEVLSQPDSMGIFVRNASDFTGDVASTSVTVNISLNDDIAVYPDFKVYGLEMVYVAEGGFYFGDGLDHSRLLYSEHEGSIYSTKSPAIIGGSSQLLFSESNADDIHVSYPTGYKAFYAMKYPFTQEILVDLLNQWNSKIQDSIMIYDHSNIDHNPLGPGVYSVFGKSSLRNNGRYTFYNNLNDTDPESYNQFDDGHTYAANFRFDRVDYTSPDFIPQTAFLFLSLVNWTGLRPMSEMEYEKAARGPLKPVPGEFAWGDNAIDFDRTIVFEREGTPLEVFADSVQPTGSGSIYFQVTHTRTVSFMRNYRVGVAAISGNDRVSSSSSYWGISDITGNGIPLLVSLEANYFNRDIHGDGGPYVIHSTWTNLCSRIAVSELVESLSSFQGIYYENDAEYKYPLLKGRGVRTP